MHKVSSQDVGLFGVASKGFFFDLEIESAMASSMHLGSYTLSPQVELYHIPKPCVYSIEFFRREKSRVIYVKTYGVCPLLYTSLRKSFSQIKGINLFY